jgi:hypothetical protein
MQQQQHCCVCSVTQELNFCSTEKNLNLNLQSHLKASVDAKLKAATSDLRLTFLNRHLCMQKGTSQT